MVEETFCNHAHELIMKNRNHLEVLGVMGVESFDSEEFLLQTDCGYLGIRGQDLSIQNLDLEKGCVAIEGHIIDVSYLDVHMPRDNQRKSAWMRLFK